MHRFLSISYTVPFSIFQSLDIQEFLPSDRFQIMMINVKCSWASLTLANTKETTKLALVGESPKMRSEEVIHFPETQISRKHLGVFLIGAGKFAGLYAWKPNSRLCMPTTVQKLKIWIINLIKSNFDSLITLSEWRCLLRAYIITLTPDGRLQSSCLHSFAAAANLNLTRFFLFAIIEQAAPSIEGFWFISVILRSCVLAGYVWFPNEVFHSVKQASINARRQRSDQLGGICLIGSNCLWNRERCEAHTEPIVEWPKTKKFTWTSCF